MELIWVQKIVENNRLKNIYLLSSTLLRKENLVQERKTQGSIRWKSQFFKEDYKMPSGCRKTVNRTSEAIHLLNLNLEWTYFSEDCRLSRIGMKKTTLVSKGGTLVLKQSFRTILYKMGMLFTLK